MPRDWPSPLGLSLGLTSVAVGQVFTLLFFYWRREVCKGKNLMVQSAGGPQYEFWEGIRTHLAQPEGFVLLGSYLTLVRVDPTCDEVQPSTYKGPR